MHIYFDEDNMPDEKTRLTMEKAALYAIAGEGVNTDAASLSVSFVDADEIHRLNREYRGVDRETDVLSFPSYDSGEIPVRTSDEASDSEPDEEIALGDVVICTEVARRQAEEFGHSYERELIYLFVHSVFHLLGYDHEEEDEKAVMRDREESVMEYLGIRR